MLNTLTPLQMSLFLQWDDKTPEKEPLFPVAGFICTLHCYQPNRFLCAQPLSIKSHTYWHTTTFAPFSLPHCGTGQILTEISTRKSPVGCTESILVYFHAGSVEDDIQ